MTTTTLYQKIDNPDGSFLFKPESDPASWTPQALPAHSLGIDVSKHQGVIDWPVVKASGKVSFVFVRASIGTTLDPMFAVNWRGAQAVGLPRGAYHYFWGGIAAKAQANFLLSALQGDLGELRFVADCEDVKNHLSGSDLRTFCETLTDQTGRRPMIYTGDWWWDSPQYLTHPQTWAADYDLWLAAYVGNQQVTQYVPDDWKLAGKSWAFWQYGQGAPNSIPGIATAIDLDVSA